MRIQEISSAIVFLACAVMSYGQSPAQGPPAASVNAASWPVFSFNNLVKDQVNTTVSGINATLAARGDVRATIVPTVLSYSPIPTQTQYPDQPNSRYYSIHYILSFDINNIQYKEGVWLTYPWSRNISISLNLNVFCNGWQSGNGTIALVTQAQPPYLDPDHSTTEQIVDQFLGGWLINYVDSQIMKSVSGVPATITNLFPCRSLGVYYGAANTVSDDAILWDKPTGIHIPILTSLNSISVQPKSVKRLPAHALDGSVLYQQVETPALEFWADFGTWDYQLPAMVENQVTLLPTAPNLEIPAPAAGNPLVIIASVAQTIGTKDSAYETFPSTTNFGAGTQTIQISKVYWQPPNYPYTTKPTKILVPAYEITFQVTGRLSSTATIGTISVGP
jgi:hypothetical protein